MKIIKDFNDATKPFHFVIKPRHALHCRRRDAENCVQARAINSVPGVKSSKVYRYITYVHFEGDEFPTRYQNSVDAIYFASINDHGGRRGVIEDIRDEVEVNGSIKVTLNVPRPYHSKEHLRSEEFKAGQKAWYHAAKTKTAASKRKYTKAGSRGLRTGQGKSHVWSDVR